MTSVRGWNASETVKICVSPSVIASVSGATTIDCVIVFPRRRDQSIHEVRRLNKDMCHVVLGVRVCVAKTVTNCGVSQFATVKKTAPPRRWRPLGSLPTVTVTGPDGSAASTISMRSLPPSMSKTHRRYDEPLRVVIMHDHVHHGRCRAEPGDPNLRGFVADVVVLAPQHPRSEELRSWQP